MNNSPNKNQEKREERQSPSSESGVFAVIKNRHNEDETTGEKDKSKKRQETPPETPREPNKGKTDEVLDEEPEGFFKNEETKEPTDPMAQAGEELDEEANNEEGGTPGLTPAKEEDSQRQNVEEAVKNHKADNIEGARKLEDELNRNNLAA